MFQENTPYTKKQTNGTLRSSRAAFFTMAYTVNAVLLNSRMRSSIRKALDRHISAQGLSVKMRLLSVRSLNDSFIEISSIGMCAAYYLSAND